MLARFRQFASKHQKGIKIAFSLAVGVAAVMFSPAIIAGAVSSATASLGFLGAYAVGTATVAVAGLVAGMTWLAMKGLGRLASAFNTRGQKPVPVETPLDNEVPLRGSKDHLREMGGKAPTPGQNPEPNPRTPTPTRNDSLPGTTPNSKPSTPEPIDEHASRAPSLG